MPDGGAIIMTGSAASIKGVPTTSVYSATKAAVRSFARTWTTDLKDRGIRVNVVSPGPIDTQMYSDTAAAQREALDEVTLSVAMGRVGRPDELAKTVTFLASDHASYITGDEIFVDGGSAQVKLAHAPAPRPVMTASRPTRLLARTPPPGAQIPGSGTITKPAHMCQHRHAPSRGRQPA